MSTLVVAGVQFVADTVQTADGEVERLTAKLKGHTFQVNRHMKDDKYCTLMIDNRMEGRQIPLDEIEFYIKVKLDLL